MTSLILRTATPLLVSLMIVYSIFVLFRGHNEPGGGFIGGLIAASAFCVLGISSGPQAVRSALRVPPMSLAGTGLFFAGISGLVAALFEQPFLTGKWYFPETELDMKIPIATPVLFDIGVWLVVVGTIVAITLVLAEWGNN
ncbi:MAG: MnhB domain-containing protein [Pseudomonadota bacterium]